MAYVILKLGKFLGENTSCLLENGLILSHPIPVKSLVLENFSRDYEMIIPNF